MIRREQFGPVTYFQITRRLLGRDLLDVGIYAVGGLVVDTGPARSASLVQAALGEVDIDRVVLTHHHEDHVGNAAAVAEHIGAPPLIHRLGVDLVGRSPRLPLYREVVWGTPKPVDAEPLGEVLETDRHRFRVIHTPGHAPDHVALHEPEQDWLFAGDLYLGDRVKLLFAYEDIGTTIESLRRLLAIPDCVLFCQHTGYHAGHQHRLGRKLDFLLGLQQRVVMHHEEGCSLREITARVEIRDWTWRMVSRGELSGQNLVRGLLRHAGKIE